MESKPNLPPRPVRRNDVHGWIVLDKPLGMTSTHAVAQIKRLFRSKKAGHAGTLDPLATGCLPIALGEATKTVPYVMDGRKAYRFTISWGSETDTDDTEGQVTATSPLRPERAAVEAILPRFTGTILQTPPRFSAIKIQGERAYDLARDGEVVELQPREVVIVSLVIVDHDEQTTTLEAECGKGTYVRAIARDMGRMLGCHGHIKSLRRTRVGPFFAQDLTPLAALRDEEGQPHEPQALSQALRPVALALSDLPSLEVSKGDATRLQRGQSILLRGRDAPLITGAVAVMSQGQLIAIGEVAQGEVSPRRIFNL
jgi:tRNA pseudouridine55 synthase